MTRHAVKRTVWLLAMLVVLWVLADDVEQAFAHVVLALTAAKFAE